MKRTKSALKQARGSLRRAESNRARKTATRSSIARAEEAIAANDTEAAKKRIAEAFSNLDKSLKKKIMHPNTAARRKSRLVAKLKKAASADAVVAEKKPKKAASADAGVKEKKTKKKAAK